MVTIIIASSNEKESIGKAIEAVIDGYKEDYQIIQVTPDEETLLAGMKKAKMLSLGERYIQIKDPKKGKSFALNLALEKATGDILVMTDGDVYFGDNALMELIYPFKDEKIGGVSGRPISLNDRSNFWGYISHLLTDAADAKRIQTFSNEKDGFYTKDNAYFPMSGYILAFRNIGVKYDSRYIDDTYISLKILEAGYQLAYAPKAKVFVKFPTNTSDYLLQRRRNFSGNKQIHKDEQFLKRKDPRSFTNELGYILYPIKYARNTKEFFWSLLLYPIRLLTWIISLIPKKKQKVMSWQSVRSTK